MNIKICGITNKEDALHAVSLGTDAVGFIFAEGSPRRVTPEVVEEISLYLAPFTQTVGVFVDQPEDVVNDIAERCRLSIVQLHGQESASYCRRMNRRVIKAFPIKVLEDLGDIVHYQGSVSAILLDTKVDGQSGGAGLVFDWGLALKAKEFDIPVILAGGINQSNVTKAIQLVNPYAIDLSSGVESAPGTKDYNKMNDIISLVKGF